MPENAQTLTYARECPLLWSVDVLVIGGGSAGSAAAVAAARQGAQVALVERMGFLGGTGAAVLDTFYGFYTPGTRSRKVVGGVPDEVVDRLTRRGAAIKRPNTYGAGTGVTYDPELLKVTWEELTTEAGVSLLFHTFFVDAIVEEGVVRGAIVANKAGMWQIRARTVVDASGDADVAFAAGAPFDQSAGGTTQSLTTTFRLANVDVEAARRVSKEALWQAMRDANASGSYHLPREEGSVHITPYAGMMATNMVRISLEDPTDPVLLSQAEVEGRRQALEYYRFLKERIDGYGEALLVSFSAYIGVRESRRILGEYWLTRDDVLSRRRFDDAVALCGAPIEDHHAGSDTRWEYIPDGGTYDIPYRCLLPRNVQGLVIAGRCLSASHDAHASVRSMAQCMALGQAAGAAAALSADQNTSPGDVERHALRRSLVSLGAILQESDIPETHES